MIKSNPAVNRAKLVDEPIVEMILSHKYFKAGLKFMKADLQSDFDGVDIICYSSGFQRNYNVKRNSSKYFNSSNFTLTLNKNKMNVFNNTSFIFIDEVANALYIVDGITLLKYILEHSDNIRTAQNDPNKSWVLLPKKDIKSMICDNDNSIIEYNSRIAKLFELGRNEELYKDL